MRSIILVLGGDIVFSAALGWTTHWLVSLIVLVAEILALFTVINYEAISERRELRFHFRFRRLLVPFILSSFSGLIAGGIAYLTNLWWGGFSLSLCSAFVTASYFFANQKVFHLCVSKDEDFEFSSWFRRAYIWRLVMDVFLLLSVVLFGWALNSWQWVIVATGVALVWAGFAEDCLLVD